MIIDTHAHFYDVPDPAAALAYSFEREVSDVVVLGIDVASNRKHIELFGAWKDNPRIHIALGLHPGNVTVEETSVCSVYFREILSDQTVHIAAIGETGLDFWYKWVRQDSVKKNEQREAFAMQLALAREFVLPVVIHSRGTWRECLDMTRTAGVAKAVFHWYSGPVDVLKDILDAGFFISVSPALEYSEPSRAAARFAPLDRILLETDTPVQVTGPDGVRVPATPADVWRSFRALCLIKGLDQSTALAQVNANAQAFFKARFATS